MSFWEAALIAVVCFGPMIIFAALAAIEYERTTQLIAQRARTMVQEPRGPRL